MDNHHDASGHMPDKFDRTLGSLHGLPDVVQSARATIEVSEPIVGNAETFIVQTVRQRDSGDTIFLQSVSAKGSLRIVIPPAVSAVIARQRDALTGKSRSKAARITAQDRKARGIRPAFLDAPRGPRKPRRKKQKRGKKAAS